MGHAGTSYRLDKSLLDNAVFDVERKLTSTLLGSAPADTVGITGNVGYLLCFNPLALFGNGSRSVMGTLCDYAHIFDFL